MAFLAVTAASYISSLLMNSDASPLTIDWIESFQGPLLLTWINFNPSMDM